MNHVKTKYEIEVPINTNLLDAINKANIPDISVFGVCDKQLACHSCAVHITSKYDALKKPSEEELDVHCELGDIYREKSTRMSCQIICKEEMDSMEIEIPRSAFFLFQEKDNEKI
jgi:ferredoxin